MSYLIAIFAGLFRAIGWIFPISDYGHLSLYYGFSSGTNNDVSALSGAVHMGIAVGIAISVYSVMARTVKEFFSFAGDIVHRSADLKRGVSPARNFMLSTMISYIPMILWAIPLGKGKNLFTVLHKTGTNSTLFDSAVFFIITGLLVFFAGDAIRHKRHGKITPAIAAAVGIVSVFTVPVAGLSFTAGVISVLLLSGVSAKKSFNYAMVMSVPVLFIGGIVEICTSSAETTPGAAFLATVLAILSAFICTRVFKYFIRRAETKIFAYYDFAIGIISFIISIVFLITA